MPIGLGSAASYTLPPVFNPRPRMRIREITLLQDVDPSTYDDLSIEEYQSTVREIDVANRVATMCEGLTPKEMAALQDEVSKRTEAVSRTVQEMQGKNFLAVFLGKKQTQLATLLRIQDELRMNINGSHFLREKERVLRKYEDQSAEPIHDEILVVAKQLQDDGLKQETLIADIGKAIESDDDAHAYDLGQQLVALQASMARSETRFQALSDLKMAKNTRRVVQGPRRA